MDIFVVFIAFLFTIAVNKYKLSDFLLKNFVRLLPVDFYCTSLKVHHGYLMGLFYRVYCVAVTRYCQQNVN